MAEAEAPRLTNGRSELERVRLDVELLKQAGILRREAEQRQEQQQALSDHNDQEERRERQRVLDGSLAAIGERLGRLERELADLMRQVRPLLDAFNAQQLDSREFNRALRIGVVITIGSLIVISILGPLISRLLFGH